MAAVAATCLTTAVQAQTAPYKCPPAGTVTTTVEGVTSTWLAPGPNYCVVKITEKSGSERTDNWYAPTLSLPANRPQDFADQIKPWTLWPLTVGKKINGRFDGVGNSIAFGHGSWRQTITVDAYERITVKAGTFDVFVISRYEEGINNSTRRMLRAWYAPVPGVVVKGTLTESGGPGGSLELASIR
jgi:hypothetical protein